MTSAGVTHLFWDIGNVLLAFDMPRALLKLQEILGAKGACALEDIERVTRPHRRGELIWEAHRDREKAWNP